MDDSQWIGIGEFARLGGVSIKALRLYAELGLLQPAAVKAQSRYRLYKRAQLPELHRIQLLKSAGFSLAEIRGEAIPDRRPQPRALSRRVPDRDPVPHPLTREDR